MTTTWPSFYWCLTGSRQRTRAPSTSAEPVPTSEGPSTEPYTSMPLVFSHSSDSQFQFTMAPSTEGFFAGAFQRYMAPLVVYPPQGPDFGFKYGMVQHTLPGSLFASGPSGSGHRDKGEDEDDAEADEEEEEEDDDDDAAVRRNPQRSRRPPPCGTGGHRRH
ncbi:hypothetical protein V6N13_024626 [Hibiscus sabdariffa]